MPDDRIQIVEAYSPAEDADIGMKREDQVAPEVVPCDTDVTDDADQAPSWNENPIDLFPHLLQFREERFVILNVPELVGVLVVPLQVPVRRGRDHEMHGSILQKGKISCVSVDQTVGRWLHNFTQKP